MDLIHDHLFLSRLQFGLTAMFHILWPVLTIGLSIFLVILEGLWLKTGEQRYYDHARFWMRLFLLNFVIGVVTGIPMEFQFGTNWSLFSLVGGDIFGHLLGFEAAMTFMLEAAFLGIMAFGWNRVSRSMHMLATCMVALGGSLSAFWIMVANSWMQTPTGGKFINGRFMLTDTLAAIFNPDAYWAVSHMWVACLEISLFVIGGVSAWYLLKGRHVDFSLMSFKMMLAAAIIITPLQIFLGDGSGKSVFTTQPEKLAALEAHWETNPPGTGASWKVLAFPDKKEQKNQWAIEIPYALSLITTHSLIGTVKGLREFDVDDQPPILLPFLAFRIMLGIGGGLFVLMIWSVYAWCRRYLTREKIIHQKWLLRAWMVALPLSYVAMEAGWITREVGRQPWVIYGVLRTHEGVSRLPAGTVGLSLLAFCSIYLLLFVFFLIFARYLILQGPLKQNQNETSYLEP
ncbi:MAG: cytochrome ubiquinol oxidase subunit I [Desulfobulbales bacterium]